MWRKNMWRKKGWFWVLQISTVSMMRQVCLGRVSPPGTAFPFVVTTLWLPVLLKCIFHFAFIWKKCRLRLLPDACSYVHELNVNECGICFTSALVLTYPKYRYARICRKRVCGAFYFFNCLSMLSENTEHFEVDIL